MGEDGKSAGTGALNYNTLTNTSVTAAVTDSTRHTRTNIICTITTATGIRTLAAITTADKRVVTPINQDRHLV
jgi:hypothetical protein